MNLGLKQPQFNSRPKKRKLFTSPELFDEHEIDEEEEIDELEDNYGDSIINKYFMANMSEKTGWETQNPYTSLVDIEDNSEAPYWAQAAIEAFSENFQF
ncbi:hypothetical protein RCL_jg732.t1 [Rhizophagus clarus]|uniref:Uncharacterized protein n=1 Tax=Rhizophagus clarus TaxID=94130 RepID=A0A8H3LDL3_9GLOM|nr:hypothetical protein RCL_jg732.t1 [Rhizophagus clarus]